MKKVIKVRLDPQSIADAIDEIQAYKEDLERRTRILLKELTNQGVDIARAKVVEYGIIHDTNLSQMIEGFIFGNKGFIFVDDIHAVFFEFGTGPKGASDPHPLSNGNYKDEGWYTAADGKPMDKLYGWLPLQHPDGNTYYYTTGQKSKPFMYETALKLREDFPEIVRKVFG